MKSPKGIIKLFILFCCLFAGSTASGQYVQFKPKYNWSIGIEHSNPAVMVTQHEYLPDNLEISQWIRKHRYWQAGIIFVPLTEEITQTDAALNIVGDTISKPIYFQSLFAIYGGWPLKLSVTRRFYFAPALNFYIEDIYYDTNNWAFAVGPTASFEYFVTKHFSVRLDPFNFNFAISSSGSFFVTLHRVMGVGLRYNWYRR